jgi:hypothetical protein
MDVRNPVGEERRQDAEARAEEPAALEAQIDANATAAFGLADA